MAKTILWGNNMGAGSLIPGDNPVHRGSLRLRYTCITANFAGVDIQSLVNPLLQKQELRG